MGSVPTSLGEWIHSPWFDLGLVVWKGYRPRVRLVLAGGHASAWFSPFWRGPAPGAQRYQAVFQAINARIRGIARQRTLTCHGDEMKHLDVVDGVIGAIRSKKDLHLEL